MGTQSRVQLFRVACGAVDAGLETTLPDLWQWFNHSHWHFERRFQSHLRCDLRTIVVRFVNRWACANRTDQRNDDDNLRTKVCNQPSSLFARMWWVACFS